MIQRITDTSSALEPLTLAQCKEQIRMYTDELDVQVADALKEVREYCEVVTARTLRTTVTRTISWGCWPSSPIKIPWPPLIDITTLAYYDAAGDAQTVDSANYRVHLSSDLQGQLEFVSTWSAPVYSERMDAITLTYNTGYETREAVPETVKRAIKILLSIEFDDTPIGREQNARDRAIDCLTAVDWGVYR